MQAALVLLAVAGSTAWLAVDASKRDWTDNSFGRNVPSWIIGSLLLWPLIFPMYVFVQRKKAPLKDAPKAKPEPAVAMAATGPSEQYGPSVDDVEEAPPAPVVERVEPIVEVEPEPIVEVEPEPVVMPEPEPVAAPEPAPVADSAPEPVAETILTAERDPVIEPEPDPVVVPEPFVETAEPVAEVEVSPSEPVLEISHPDLPPEEAPPGLSVDAFKDIKPVAFGGAVIDDEPAPPAAPAPVVEPAIEPEPAVEAEPVVEPEPAPESQFEPLNYPLETEPLIEPEPEPAPEPEPVMAAAVTEDPKAKKRGFRIPNPELKLPSFGKKRAPKAATPAAAPESAKPKGLRLPGKSLKLPQITLPSNLQGPLSDVERKIVLGSVVAIVAAGAFGYSTAPSDDAAVPPPTPAPAAASR